jgi:hypothetical protein
MRLNKPVARCRSGDAGAAGQDGTSPSTRSRPGDSTAASWAQIKAASRTGAGSTLHSTSGRRPASGVSSWPGNSQADTSVHQGVLTAEVNGNPSTRVPLLNFSLAHATVHAIRGKVQISGIVVTLTKTAANALDSMFSASLFTPALELGTASTTLTY